MCRLRRITLADIPLSVGIMKGPRQIIFARNEQGRTYVDPNVPDTIATTTAWFGWTNQPEPAKPKRKTIDLHRPGA